ncbi:MAG: nitroreductase family protein [Anaerolineales bacterium]
MLSELIRKCRSYRRYHAEISLSLDTLRELIGLARLIPSAFNRQPLRYLLINDAQNKELVFSYLVWPVFGEWTKPAQNERPAAYIVILGDTEIAAHFGVEAGIAAQTILLGAVARGLGGCIMGALDRESLRDALKIPERFRILLVIALGVPAEQVVIEPLAPGQSPRFWRDASGIQHVEKRSVDDLILNLAE